MYGAIKLHTSKERKPIRPIVSWKDSQGYNLAEYVTTEYRLQLPNTYV
jgi:hypothetical protein